MNPTQYHNLVVITLVTAGISAFLPLVVTIHFVSKFVDNLFSVKKTQSTSRELADGDDEEAEADGAALQRRVRRR